LELSEDLGWPNSQLRGGDVCRNAREGVGLAISFTLQALASLMAESLGPGPLGSGCALGAMRCIAAGRVASRACRCCLGPMGPRAWHCGCAAWICPDPPRPARRWYARCARHVCLCLHHSHDRYSISLSSIERSCCQDFFAIRSSAWGHLRAFGKGLKFRVWRSVDVLEITHVGLDLSGVAAAGSSTAAIPQDAW